MTKHDKRLRKKTNAVLLHIEQTILDEGQLPDTEQTLSSEEFASRSIPLSQRQTDMLLTVMRLK